MSTQVIAMQAIREAARLVAKELKDSNPDDPLRGRCVEMALTVRAIFGGDILGEKVACPCPEDCGGTHHYWNKLPDGTQYDLASKQFGGDGLHPQFTHGVVEKVPLGRAFDELGFVSDVLGVLRYTAKLIV